LVRIRAYGGVGKEEDPRQQKKDALLPNVVNTEPFSLAMLQAWLLDRSSWSLWLQEDRDLVPALTALQGAPRFSSFCDHIESEAVRCMAMLRKRGATDARLDSWEDIVSSDKAVKRRTL
jgi:hypothetical protein